MQTIITPTDLRAAIIQLELRQAEEGILLKQQALQTYESIKPINLIKSVFQESAESEELRGSILNSSIGLSAGYVSKLLFQSFSGSPVKKVLGTAIMFGIRNLIAHNPETVKKWSHVLFSLFKNLLSEKDKKDEGFEENETRQNDKP